MGEIAASDDRAAESNFPTQRNAHKNKARIAANSPTPLTVRFIANLLPPAHRCLGRFAPAMDANRYHEGARCETFENLSKQKKLDAEGKLVRCDRT
jgi:hypothetical protein